MPNNISKTEHKIIRLHMTGLSRKEIAAIQFRAISTINKEFDNISKKTGTHNGIELHNWYLEEIMNVGIKKLLQDIDSNA